MSLAVNYTLPPDYPGTLEDYVQSIFNSNCLDVVGTAMVLFDTFIVFGDEVRLVWNGRWGFPTLVYLLNHYGILFQMVLNQVAVNDLYLSEDHCLSWNMASNWFIPIIMMFVEAMLVLRVTALYDNNRNISLLLWTLYAVCVASMFLLTGLLLTGVGPFASADGSILACDIRQLGENLFYTMWIPSLILETVLVLMTLWKSIIHHQEGVNTPVYTALVRDGFLYFFVVFSVMVANLTICMTVQDVYYALTSHRLTLCISSILSSRLFLHLRKIAYGKQFSGDMNALDRPPSLPGSTTSEPLAGWLEFHEHSGYNEDVSNEKTD